jgi:P-type Ca2+ transporter type 2C
MSGSMLSLDEWNAKVASFTAADVGSDAVSALGGSLHVATHLLGIPDILSTGLTPEQVERMRKQYGSNKIPEKRPKTFLEHLLEAFEDDTLMILVAAAVLSLFNALFVSSDPNDTIEAMSILVAIVIVSGVASTLNLAQDREFRALKQLSAELVLTTRGGTLTSIPRDAVVVGDLIEVRAGDKLPADALLLPVSRQGVSVDESSATGESEALHKTPHGHCVMLAGTRVLEGAGKAVVVAVGEHSTLGRNIAKSQGGEDDDGPTPLQERLSGLATTIGWFGTVAALLTSGALAVISLRSNPSQLFQMDFWLNDMLQYAVVGVTIVVVAVPEGLPLAVTVSLAFSSQAMVKDKILVRKLQACETMGSATVICSDKTGTLTQNRMTVVTGRIAGRPFFLHGEPRSSLAVAPTDRVLVGSLHSSLPPEVCGAFGMSVTLNSTAEQGRDESGETSSASLVWLGNPSECAMLAFADSELLQHPQSIRSAASNAGAMSDSDGDEGMEVPGLLYRRNFSSSTKSMASAVLLPDAMGGECWLYLKGAFERVLEQCDSELQSDGRSARLDRRRVLGQFEPATANALRTIAVARKAVSRERRPRSEKDWEALENEGGFELVSVLGIKDPLRPEVPRAVRDCQEAGIRVVMVTGDHPATAEAIARGCGILPETTGPGMVMRGSDFASLEHDEAALLAAARRVMVLARSLPDHKHLLVDALRRDGQVVAATGDGTNDGPALKHAHVGMAMGITGTDVAKDASSIVILDDNFSSIRKAVVWGRSIQENVRKFLVFQITINLVALIVTFAAACSLGAAANDDPHAGEMQERLARQLPLNSPQMLFCNLLMDSLAALALATEPPSDSLLDRHPERKDSPLITSTMWKHILGHATMQLVILIVLFLNPQTQTWLAVEQFKSAEHRTVIFNAFIMLQLFNLPFARKVNDELNVLADISRSKLFLLIWLGVLVTQVVIVQYGGAVFGTVPLDVEQWMRCVAIGALTVPMGIVLRLVPLGTPAARDKPKRD